MSKTIGHFLPIGRILLPTIRKAHSLQKLSLSQPTKQISTSTKGSKSYRTRCFLRGAFSEQKEFQDLKYGRKRKMSITHRSRERTCGCGGEGGWGRKGSESGISRCRLSHIGLINNKALMSSVHMCSVLYNSLQPYGLQAAKLLCPWSYPGKNTGMGFYFLLQRIFLTQTLNPHLLHLLHQQVVFFLTPEPSGKSNIQHRELDAISCEKS